MTTITPYAEAVAERLPRSALAILGLITGILWILAIDGGAAAETFGLTSNLLHETFHDARHVLGVPCD